MAVNSVCHGFFIQLELMFMKHNAKQMLVHKGGKIKNWVGECRDVTPTNCSLKIYLKSTVGLAGGGGVRMDVTKN